MKIEDKRTDESCRLGTLENGDVFIGLDGITDGDLFMKIEEILSEDAVYNAISLIAGDGWCFTDDYLVQKINAKVVIE